MTAQTLLTVVVLVLAFVGYIACVMRARWITLGLTLGVALLIWDLSPPGGDTAFQWLGAGIVLIIGFWVAHLPILQSGSAPKPGRPPAPETGNRIVVDGTNVIYWDGDADLQSLVLVTDALCRRGFEPIIFLDASTRHHLKEPSLDQHAFADALGLPPDQITLCPAGTEADEFLIKYARAESLPIVSNDRFGDRAQQVKGIKRIRGVIAHGKAVFEGF